jgi:hypothetical protein
MVEHFVEENHVTSFIFGFVIHKEKILQFAGVPVGN